MQVDLAEQETIWLDLGVGSQDLGNYAEMADVQLFNRKVEFFLASEGKLAGVGGSKCLVLIALFGLLSCPQITSQILFE